MTHNFDYVVNINDNTSIWYFFARIVKLWSTIDSNSSEKPATVHLILMDSYVSFYIFYIIVLLSFLTLYKI